MELLVHSGMNIRQREVKYLTQSQVKQLFQMISSPRDKLMFNMMYKYGLRASEVGLLRWNDIDLNEKKVMIWRLKGGISGKYSLFPDTIVLIKEWLIHKPKNYPYLFISREKRPISRSMLDFLFKKYAKRADLPLARRHSHTLRHSIAVHMLDAGHEQEEVKDHLGHRYIQSTDVYAVLSNKKRDLVFSKMLKSKEIVNCII